MSSGLSSIIIVVLLLLITVSMIYISFGWISTSSEKMQEEVGKQTISKNGCLLIENINTDIKKITLRNCGTNDLSNFVVYIDSRPVAYYLGKINAGNIESIDFTEDVTSGNHEIYVSSDYAKSPKITFSIAGEMGGMCDVYIYQSMTPYVIVDNNKYYCLAENVHIDNKNAINFSSGVQNTILDCQGYSLDGNNAANTNGIYLTGSNTKDNTVKNCFITDFNNGIYLNNGPSNNILINNIVNMSYNKGILLSSSNNNTIYNNIVSFTIIGDGIYLVYSNYNNVSKNIVFSNYTDGIEGLGDDGIVVNNSNFSYIANNTVYRVYGSYDIVDNSFNNTFIDNVGRDSWAIFATFGTIASNNTIRDGSIGPFLPSSPVPEDYYVQTGATNYFINTNFTTSRAIRIINEGGGLSTSSWFVYNNESTGNIWLKTAQTGTRDPIITRKIISWDSSLMKWNDTSDNAITAYYNLTGLTPNTDYYVYNNSVLIYTLNSGSNSQINFTIRLPASSQREIKVSTGCDYYIFNPDYTIDQSNKIYCLIQSISVSSTEYRTTGVIEFASGIENSTLDCKNYKIDSNLWRSYGVNINRTTNKNNTIKNCLIEDVTDGIRLVNNSYNKIINNTMNNLAGTAINLLNSSNNSIYNNIANGNDDEGVLITNSKNNTIANNVFNYNYFGIWLDTSSNNIIANNTLIGNYDDAIWLYSSSNNNVFTNNSASGNGDEGITVSSSNNNIFTNNSASGNGVVGFTLYNSASGNILTNNTVINNGDHGFLMMSSSNSLVNNVVRNNTNGVYISCSSTNITGGSIFNNTYDYYFYSAGTTNNFTDTNFTSSRKIWFYDTTSWFNYRNSSSNNIWLKTNVSAQSTITRKLVSMNQNLIVWNDTSNVAITARYNLTGLTPNTNYYAYNNGGIISGSPFNSGSNGQINFTTSLSASSEREIKVNSTIVSSDNILWTKFNEGSGSVAYDSSPYGNNGTLYGGLGTTGWSTDCISGNCLKFDGGDDYIEVPTHDSLNPNYITIEAWIKPATDNIKSTGSVGGAMIVKKIVYASELGYWLQWNNVSASTPHSVSFNIGNGTNWKTISSSAESVPLNQWTHVVGTYNGSFMRIYINGALNNSQTHSGLIAPSTDNLRIGAESSTYKIFNGTIDELKIWNRALNASEIEQEYQQYKPPDRILWFKFNEANGIKNYDSSGNGNNGTYNGESFNDGTINGAIKVNGLSGFGKALSFNGSNDYVNVARSESLNITNAITIGAWVYRKDLSGIDCIVSKHYSTRGYRLCISGTGKLWMYGGNGSSSASNFYVESNYAMSSDNWYYVTGTYNSSTGNLSVYINGTFDNTKFMGGPLVEEYSSYPDLYIGKTWGTNYYFNGTIDELRIWNRSLTEAEIQAEMQSSMPIIRPVASWRFEDSDTANYANDTHIWVNGTFGSALSFDGGDDYVQVPDDSSLDVSQITMAAWVYPRGLSGDNVILMKGNSYFLAINNNTPTSYRLEMNLYINGAYRGRWTTVNSAITLNKWSFVAGTYDGNNIKLYVDGQDKTSGTPTYAGSIASSTSVLRIGTRPESVTTLFNGNIDGLRIWNRSLTEAEIQAEMYAS